MEGAIGTIAFIVYSLAVFRAGKTDSSEKGPMKAWGIAFVAAIVLGICVTHS